MSQGQREEFRVGAQVTKCWRGFWGHPWTPENNIVKIKVLGNGTSGILRPSQQVMSHYTEPPRIVLSQ